MFVSLCLVCNMNVVSGLPSKCKKLCQVDHDSFHFTDCCVQSESANNTTNKQQTLFPSANHINGDIDLELYTEHLLIAQKL